LVKCSLEGVAEILEASRFRLAIVIGYFHCTLAQAERVEHDREPESGPDRDASGTSALPSKERFTKLVKGQKSLYTEQSKSHKAYTFVLKCKIADLAEPGPKASTNFLSIFSVKNEIRISWTALSQRLDDLPYAFLPVDS